VKLEDIRRKMMRQDRQGEYACDECEAVLNTEDELKGHKAMAHRLADVQEATFASSSPD
jgi:hypothetical protein